MLDLLAATAASRTTGVTGKWRVIRLCLDLAAQEWINVGVLFRGEDGQTVERLVTSTALTGLGCLYDEDAIDNAHFLLNQAQYAMEVGAPLPDGWNVRLGPEKFVRGDSANSIIEDLFLRMVPLARHQIENRVDREGHPHATRPVRAEVRKIINRHLHEANPTFWPSSPVTTLRDGVHVQMDMQIAETAGSDSLYGTISSAWYKTAYHRNASLSQGVRAVTLAREAFPNARSVMYLLQPPAAVNALTLEDHLAIDADIETTRWLLRKIDARLQIATTVRGVAHAILDDLRLLPQVA